MKGEFCLSQPSPSEAFEKLKHDILVLSTLDNNILFCNVYVVLFIFIFKDLLYLKG